MLRLSCKVSVANIPIGNPRLISLRYAPYKLLLSGARDTRVVPSGKYTGTQIIWKLTHRIVQMALGRNGTKYNSINRYFQFLKKINDFNPFCVLCIAKCIFGTPTFTLQVSIRDLKKFFVQIKQYHSFCQMLIHYIQHCPYIKNCEKNQIFITVSKNSELWL